MFHLALKLRFPRPVCVKYIIIVQTANITRDACYCRCIKLPVTPLALIESTNNLHIGRAKPAPGRIKSEKRSDAVTNFQKRVTNSRGASRCCKYKVPKEIQSRKSAVYQAISCSYARNLATHDAHLFPDLLSPSLRRTRPIKCKPTSFQRWLQNRERAFPVRGERSRRNVVPNRRLTYR